MTYHRFHPPEGDAVAIRVVMSGGDNKQRLKDFLVAVANNGPFAAAPDIDLIRVMPVSMGEKRVRGWLMFLIVQPNLRVVLYFSETLIDDDTCWQGDVFTLPPAQLDATVDADIPDAAGLLFSRWLFATSPNGRIWPFNTVERLEVTMAQSVASNPSNWRSE